MTKEIMSRLTHTSITARKVIKYGVIGFAAYLVLRLIFIGAINLWKKLNPPPPPPPTVAFGKLPKLEFGQSIKGDFKFVLETPTGGLPKFFDRASVYFMTYKRPSLLALERAKQTANLLGFAGAPIALDAETYAWRIQLPASLELVMNIVSGSFEINYNWQNDEKILTEKNLPGNNQAIQEAKSYLDRAQLLADDLELGEIEVSYLKAVAGKMVKAVSLSEANFVKVDFYRKRVEGIPVEEMTSAGSLTGFAPKSGSMAPTVTPEPDDGVVSFILSASLLPQKRFVHLSYNFFPVVYENSSTYPLKDISLAWEEVKNGQAYVASVKEGISDIVIRKIYLAYYDTGPQEFLQPVYVFEGDDDFIAYVSAVDSSWTVSE